MACLTIDENFINKVGKIDEKIDKKLGNVSILKYDLTKEDKQDIINILKEYNIKDDEYDPDDLEYINKVTNSSGIVNGQSSYTSNSNIVFGNNNIIDGNYNFIGGNEIVTFGDNSNLYSSILLGNELINNNINESILAGNSNYNNEAYTSILLGNSFKKNSTTSSILLGNGHQLNGDASLITGNENQGGYDSSIIIGNNNNLNTTSSVIFSDTLEKISFDHTYFSGHVYTPTEVNVNESILVGNIEEFKTNADNIFAMGSGIKVNKSEDIPAKFILGLANDGNKDAIIEIAAGGNILEVDRDGDVSTRNITPKKENSLTTKEYVDSTNGYYKMFYTNNEVQKNGPLYSFDIPTQRVNSFHLDYIDDPSKLKEIILDLSKFEENQNIEHTNQGVIYNSFRIEVNFTGLCPVMGKWFNVKGNDFILNKMFFRSNGKKIPIGKTFISNKANKDRFEDVTKQTSTKDITYVKLTLAFEYSIADKLLKYAILNLDFWGVFPKQYS